MRMYGPLWSHLFGGTQPRDIREWSLIELYDRVDWVEEHLKARSGK